MLVREPCVISVDEGRISLQGELQIPDRPTGIVVFAHGSGSSRLSPRNAFVAEQIHAVGIATLLFDLLTTDEDEIYENRFDIELLTNRLISAVEWVRGRPDLRGLPIGLFGASTGAAAALKAAARLGPTIRAVVSRGGRPDLAGGELEEVVSPSLLIVGGFDAQVLELNESALARMVRATDKKLSVVPGATHLFEEPGTLREAAGLAATWFLDHLPTTK